MVITAGDHLCYLLTFVAAIITFDSHGICSTISSTNSALNDDTFVDILVTLVLYTLFDKERRKVICFLIA